uniref:F-box associated domain-containing protein n=1 Tax=Oryza nivara TaxID=4536 RepID=A0A0E0JCS7_ORYNI
MYAHRLSGEYRVLFWKTGKRDQGAVYYVGTLGSSKKPRCIGLPMASDEMKPVLSRGVICIEEHPPVILHGCLHWDPGDVYDKKVVVFDPVAESFIRLIPSPTAFRYDANLHEMDGMLGISRTNDRTRIAKLWVLQDYELGVCKGKLVDKFQWDGVAPSVTGHWFKESLVSHPFFQLQDNAHERLGKVDELLVNDNFNLTGFTVKIAYSLLLYYHLLDSNIVDKPTENIPEEEENVVTP